MPAMFKANESCFRRTFGLYGIEALHHRSELKILWDTFRSQIAEFWFPYDRRIAGSQTIAEDRTWLYLLRSSAIMIAGSQTIAEVCFHMIADDRRTFCNLRSSAIIWKPALSTEYVSSPCLIRRQRYAYVSMLRNLRKFCYHCEVSRNVALLSVWIRTS